MSLTLIKTANYNPDTKVLEVMCRCNNVWPRTYRPAEYPLTNDEEVFRFIRNIAGRSIQMRKWSAEFCTLFAEFPELIAWGIMPWEEYNSRRNEIEAAIAANEGRIVARFKELTKTK